MNDAQVLNVWSWCSDAYLRHGRRLNLPAGTDPHKTYQWRYAAAIAEKFEQWDLHEEAAKKFIDIAIQIAKENGVLNKGLAVLHQQNMLELCYEKLQAESDSNAQTIDSIRYVNSWFLKKIGDNDAVEVLLSRANPHRYCNLTLWYQGSHLPSLFLALSRSCSKSLARLNRDHSDERALLPKLTELYLLRDSFLKDQKNLTQAREIFAQDWREPCLLPL